MRVSRGEMAFGAGVFALASILLLLAVGRLTSPVLRPDAIAAAVAMAPVPSAATVAASEKPAKRPPRAQRRRPQPQVLPRAAVAKHVPANAATATALVRRASVVAVAPKSRAIRAMPKHVKRSHVAGAPVVLDLTVKQPATAAVVPKSEATPEPPIGYDEQPALLRVNVPGAEATSTP